MVWSSVLCSPVLPYLGQVGGHGQGHSGGDGCHDDGGSLVLSLLPVDKIPAVFRASDTLWLSCWVFAAPGVIPLLPVSAELIPGHGSAATVEVSRCDGLRLSGLSGGEVSGANTDKLMASSTSGNNI